jgi:hypothetical protein
MKNSVECTIRWLMAFGVERRIQTFWTHGAEKIHVNERLFQPSRVQTASQSGLTVALRVGLHSDSESQRPIRSSSIYHLAVLFSNNRLDLVPFVFSSRAIDSTSWRSFFSELNSLYPLAVLFSPHRPFDSCSHMLHGGT